MFAYVYKLAVGVMFVWCWSRGIYLFAVRVVMFSKLLVCCYNSDVCLFAVKMTFISLPSGGGVYSRSSHTAQT